MVFYVEDILGALERWNFKETLPADAYKKVGRKMSVYFCIISIVGLKTLIHMSFMQVRLMCSYCRKHDESEVPDPYYGGPQGFEKVFHVAIRNVVWSAIFVYFHILRLFHSPIRWMHNVVNRMCYELPILNMMF